MSVLCLYLCDCMSVANIGPYIKTRSYSHYFSQCSLPLLGTPVAALQYVMNFWFLWMTSCFRVMTNSVGLRDAAAVTSATVGGCREVSSTVWVVSAAVITSAALAKPPQALSSGSACSLGYPRVETPTRGESADPNTPRPPTDGWSPAGRSSGWVVAGPAVSADTDSDSPVNAQEE